MAAEDRRQRRFVIRGLERLTERQSAALTLRIHENLVNATPVDTGWAKGNWVPSKGQPFVEEVGREGNPSAARGRQDRGEDQVRTFTLSDGRLFIVNNVPYIQVLNDGHSQQAPSGFVERAVETAVAEVQLAASGVS